MIVIINPNSTEAMTDQMVEVSQAVCPGLPIEGWTSHDGPPAIQGPQDGVACVPPLLDLVRTASAKGAAAIIIGCADDTGLHQARELADCPVIGIGQAAYHLASLVGPRFSIVTTLSVSAPILQDNVHALGLGQNLVRVRASGVPVLEIESQPDTANPRIIAEIRRAESEDGVQSVVLGCAGMSHIPDRYQATTSVRLIDGVRTAARIAAII